MAWSGTRLDRYGQLSNSQVSATDLFVGGQFFHGAVIADLSFFEHVDAIRNELGEVDVLLGKKDAYALLFERDDHGSHLLDNYWRNAFGRFVEQDKKGVAH